MDYFEIVRKKFKPKNVRVLFIAESRPASGEFIYDGNSPLFDSLFNAFREAFPRVEKGSFLEYMKSNNYYLDDLCLSPVDNLDKELRNMEREKGAHELSIRLSRYNPQYIICIMKDILPYVEKAIELSKIDVQEIYSTAFPAYSGSNKEKFHQDVVNFLEITHVNQVQQKN